jgi:hypothetical protein
VALNAILARAAAALQRNARQDSAVLAEKGILFQKN